MNQAQREALAIAIMHEEDWLNATRLYMQARGLAAETDREFIRHERRLAELKDGL